MRTAFLFPGQASQTPGMRDLVADVRPDLLSAVADAVGEDPFPRVDEGTDFAQPAIFAASLAGLATLDEAPDAVAGHSLGELAALVCAGVLAEDDALRLVVLRGRLMQQAGVRAGNGGMLALVGKVEEEAVEALAARHGVTVANDNAPGQIVLSGEKSALAAAGEEAEGMGLRALPLNVAGAFHSPAMAEALPEWEAALAATTIGAPLVPAWSCVSATPFDDVRAQLAAGLISPVRWRQTLTHLQLEGIDRFVEVGPGKVLSKLVGRTLGGVQATTAEKLAGARA